MAGTGFVCAADLPPPFGGTANGEGGAESSLDFAGSVRLALEQSPFLASSSIEIDLRRIDESDSRYSVVPSVSVRTRYYVNQPGGRNGDNKPYDIEFVTEPYNPVEPYYSLQARRLVTRIAVLTHVKAIGDCLARLAGAYLELDALDALAARQDRLVELAGEQVAFTGSRMKTGGASLLDARVAEQEESLARMEKQRILDSGATVREGIKGLLGLDSLHRATFDSRDAAGRILGEFRSAAAPASQVLANAPDTSILALKKELQELNIKIARARYLPHLLFKVESGDPLNRTDSSDLYFSVGLEMPLWDGFKRSHDITRQKRVMKQLQVDGEAKDIDFAGRWKAAQDRLKNAEADLGIAVRQGEIAELKEKQSEIAYKSGRQPYSVVLSDRKSRLESQKNIAAKTFERDKALLGLYHLSGELLKRYVDAGKF